MFCPNCGNKMNDDAEFCNNCGRKNTKVQKKQLNFKTNKQKIIGLILGIIGIVCVIVIGLKLSTPKLSKEALKCKSNFLTAMNEFKTGEIPLLKKNIVGENLGSIEELLELLNINGDNVTKVCKVFFNSFEVSVEDIQEIDKKNYIIKAKMKMPNNEFFKEASKRITEKLDITDLGVLLGRDSKITKIVDKIIEGYSEVNLNDYSFDLINYDIKMVKVGDTYKIDNFSNFFDNSQFGKLITKIRSLLKTINSFLN